MDLETCPHCNSAVLPTRDGMCPNCKRSFDDPVLQQSAHDVELWRQRQRTRRRIAVIVGLAVAVLAAVFSWHAILKVLEVAEEGRQLRERQMEMATLWSEFFEAHELENWASVVRLGEKFRNGGHARPSMNWMLAQGYFNTDRYEDAVETQRRYVEYEELRSDPQTLAWSCRVLAKYLSFAYAETGNSQYELEVDRCIRKEYECITGSQLSRGKPKELGSPLEQYRAFGAIKYRLDTRETISDEAWRAKYFTGSTPANFFEYVSTWVEAIRTAELGVIQKYKTLSQPWDQLAEGD